MVESVEIPFRALDDLNGATLAGRFRLDRMVGRGGFGAVFVGEQTSVGRRCAVKVLVPHVLEKPSNIVRFQREARATSQLAHPNTIVIYDFGLDDERRLLFLAMEFIDGESLRERIRRERTMDVETTVWIAHQAAGSLQDAHERGLVHRDVKPHNIMMTHRGGDPNFVKVIDFGIAKFLDEASILETFHRVTQTGTIIGTPAYMSPEQVRAQELDGRSDQYSLAACVYQMLTGRPLFTGESPVDVATKQLMHRPRPASELNPAVGAAVDAVLMRALGKERSDRYPTITEFTIALAEAAGVVLGLTDSAERRREPPAIGESTARDVVVPTLPMAGLPVVAGSASTTQPLQGDTAPAVVKSIDPPTASLHVQAHVGAPEPVAASETRRLPTVLLLGAATVIVGVVLASQLRRPPAATEESARPATVVPLRPGAEVVVQVPDVSAADLGVASPATPTSSPEPKPKPKPKPEPTEAPKPKEPPKPEPIATPTPDPPVVTEIPVEPAQEPTPAAGRVTVTVVPWGTVVIDGIPRGEALKQTHELPAGTHVIEVHQGGQSVARKTVDVQPGKNTMVKLFAAP